MTQQLKEQPNSKESEMIVLGSALTSHHALGISTERLEETDFYYNEHKLVFRVIKEFYKKDLPVDVHLVVEKLKRRELLSAVGGVGYLTALGQYAGTSAHIEEYAKAVHNKAQLRRIIDQAQYMEKQALENPEDVEAFFRIHEARFKTISDGDCLKRELV